MYIYKAYHTIRFQMYQISNISHECIFPCMGFSETK